MWNYTQFVGEYAEKDAEIIKVGHTAFEISKQDLWDVFNLETSLFPYMLI